MDRMEKLRYLNQLLLDEMPEYRPQAAEFPLEAAAQRRLLRSLMNLRPPLPLGAEFLAIQDQVFSAEREERGVVNGDSLPVTAAHPNIALWQGDITLLRCDAIVNAAGVLLPLSRLHRQCHPLSGRLTAPGCLPSAHESPGPSGTQGPGQANPGLQPSRQVCSASGRSHRSGQGNPPGPG